MKVPERDRPVCVLDGEVRRRGTDARRPGATITAGQKKRKKARRTEARRTEPIISDSAYEGAGSSIGGAGGIAYCAGAE